MTLYTSYFSYILFKCLCSVKQCTVWNTWGPISNSSFTAYPSWNASTIALFGNWGTITYVIFTIPFIWICDVYGNPNEIANDSSSVRQLVLDWFGRSDDRMNLFLGAHNESSPP